MSVTGASDPTVEGSPSRLELVRADQAGRWRAGEQRLAEAYFADFPRLRERPDDALVLIAGEMALRAERGDPIDAEEYARRFPDLADALRLQAALAPLLADDPGAMPDVPGYELLAEIGRGAMGAVYRARQDGLNRSVALKLLHAGLTGPDAAARLRVEAEAVSRLAHANIVGVIGTGETASGTPFLAMEYVDGPTLAHWAGGRPLPAMTAAALVETLAAAVEHAHARGVVHRDLKPANVLLHAPDATGFGIVKIADFGLARVLESNSGLTVTGAVLGTPAYMPPEQAAGGAKVAQPTADVYALGAILYELLTGRPPFRTASMLELLRQVAEQEPAPPSRLVPGVPRDLETIALKCLAKEPAGRYPSAAALADDLARFRAGEPVRARPVGPFRQSLKWARRHPSIAGLVAAVLLLLSIITLDATLAARRLERALMATRAAEREAGVRLAESLIEQADANRLSQRPGQRFRSLRLLQEAARIARAHGATDRVAARLRDTAVAALALPDLEPGDDLGTPTCAAVDPTFETLARRDSDGVCRVIRLADGAELSRIPDCEPMSIFGLTPGGEVLAGRTDHVRLWVSGKLLADLPGSIWCSLRPDGRQAAIAFDDGVIVVLELPSGRQIARLAPEGVSRGAEVALAPDGSTVTVTSYFSKRVVMRAVATGAVHAELPHPLGANGATYSSDGSLVATAGNESRLRIWDARTGALLREFGPCNPGSKLGFAAGDRLLLNSGWSNTCEVWDAVTGMRLCSTSLLIPSWRMQTDRAGERMLALDGTRLRWWHLADGHACRTLQIMHRRDRPWIGRPALHPDGRLLAVPAVFGVRLWDLLSGAELTPLDFGVDGGIQGLMFDAAGALVVNCPWGITRWPVRAEGVRREFGPPEQLTEGVAGYFHMSADRKLLAYSARHVSRFEPYAGTWLRRLDGPSRARRFTPGVDNSTVVLSPDGRWMLEPGWQVGQSKLWDTRTGQSVERPAPPGGFGQFSPCGRYLYMGQDGTLWRLAPERRDWQRGPHVGPTEYSAGAAFSPDGRWLAITLQQGITRVIDSATGAELTRLADPFQHSGIPVWTPDSGRLVTVHLGTDHPVRIWDLRLLRDQLTAAGLDAAPFPAPPGLADDTIPTPLEAHWTGQPPQRGPLPPTTPNDAALLSGEDAIIAGRWDDASRLLSGITDEQLRDEARRLQALADRRAGRPATLPASETPPEQWYFWDGYTAHDQRRHALAAALYAEALHYAPDSPQALHMLARLLAIGPPTVRNPAMAVPLARRADALRPNRPLIMHTLGAALLRNGQSDEAITRFRAGLTFGSPDADGSLLTDLALALCQRGDPGAADAANAARRWFAEVYPEEATSMPRAFRDDLERLRAELDAVRPP